MFLQDLQLDEYFIPYTRQYIKNLVNNNNFIQNIPKVYSGNMSQIGSISTLKNVNTNSNIFYSNKMYLDKIHKLHIAVDQYLSKKEEISKSITSIDNNENLSQSEK